MGRIIPAKGEWIRKMEARYGSEPSEVVGTPNKTGPAEPKSPTEVSAVDPALAQLKILTEEVRELRRLKTPSIGGAILGLFVGWLFLFLLFNGYLI